MNGVSGISNTPGTYQTKPVKQTSVLPRTEEEVFALLKAAGAHEVYISTVGSQTRSSGAAGYHEGIIVFVTREALERLKNDPVFLQENLDLLRRNFEFRLEDEALYLSKQDPNDWWEGKLPEGYIPPWHVICLVHQPHDWRQTAIKQENWPYGWSEEQIAEIRAAWENNSGEDGAKKSDSLSGLGSLSEMFAARFANRGKILSMQSEKYLIGIVGKYL